METNEYIKFDSNKDKELRLMQGKDWIDILTLRKEKSA